MVEKNSTQESLERLLSEIPPLSDAQNGKALEPAAHAFLSSEFVTRRLNDLLNDDELARSMLKLSYVHINGFRKLVIFSSSGDCFHLRVHQWLSKEHFDQNVHDHRFSFWSLVLKGLIINRLWHPSVSGKPFTHYEYWPREGRDIYEMKKVGSVCLQAGEPFEVRENGLYFFDGAWLHTTDYVDYPVTLLLEDRRALRPYANVFVREGKEYRDVVKYDSPALSMEEYREGIRAVLQA